MPLFFADGEAFAVGAMPYQYRPATRAETTPRVILTVAIGNYRTAAFVDTGGVYLLCTPPLAQRLQLDPAQGTPASRNLFWRGDSLTGVLHRLPLTFHAAEGESMTIEVTAFVPQLKPDQEWDDELMCILGMQGCLEFMRFAIDPRSDRFFFGELSGEPQ